MTASPLDEAGAQHLTARCVDPGDEDGPRIFGYGVETDLARHYRFTDGVALLLTGELLDEVRARAFEIALWFAAPCSVLEAPSHGSVLGKVVGARPSATIAIGAIGLAEEARTLFDECLAAETALDPDTFCARDEIERRRVERLVAAIAPLEVPLLSRMPRLDLAVVLVWRACGLAEPEAIVAAWTCARLPAIVAESCRWRPGDLASYPTNEPRFVYEGKAR